MTKNGQQQKPCKTKLVAAHQMNVTVELSAPTVNQRAIQYTVLDCKCGHNIGRFIPHAGFPS